MNFLSADGGAPSVLPWPPKDQAGIDLLGNLLGLTLVCSGLTNPLVFALALVVDHHPPCVRICWIFAATATSSFASPIACVLGGRLSGRWLGDLRRDPRAGERCVAGVGDRGIRREAARTRIAL